MEAHESVDSCYPLSVDATVAGPTGHLDLNKSGLAQKTLNEPLERSGVNNLGEDVVKLCSPGLRFLRGVRVVGGGRSLSALGQFVLLVILSNRFDNGLLVNPRQIRLGKCPNT